MEQLEFPLLARMGAPSAVPTFYVDGCKSYRQAVRQAWAMRRIHFMTVAQLAAEGGFVRQHVGDWLEEDDRPRRRNLPAACIAVFETLVGNTLISQWLAARSQLTVLEEMQATRAAA